jgi:hypothetical protein
VSTIPAQAATLTNVAGSASSVALFAASGRARGRAVWNDSAATLYLKFGASASATSCTVKLDPDDYYEFPQPVYAGAVEGVWASATGAARVTEW